MSKTFPQGVKEMKILAPSAVGHVPSTLRCNVIVVAKYDFHAETPHELSIAKGDVLKLVDRLLGGWVLVKFVDRVVPPGLVPSLYVDIAVNDPMNPITVQWLHDAECDANTSFCDAQVLQLLENNEPLTINNRPYPLLVSVANYLTYDNRFWYRVDVAYSTGEHAYLCRYYQNFYDLHLALLAARRADAKEALPKLPEPVPSEKRNLAELSDLFARRCRELSTYMHELVLKKEFQVAAPLVAWLGADYQDLPGFVVEDPLNDSSEAISQRILPGSVILASKIKTLPPEPKKPDEVVSKYVAPAKGALLRSKLKNIYNHYQQAAQYHLSVSRLASTSEAHRRPSTGERVDMGRSRTINGAANGKTMPAPPHMTPRAKQAQFSPQLPTPKTPGTPPGVRSVASGDAHAASGDASLGCPTPTLRTSQDGFVRCKIKTQTSDNVVVRLERREVGLVAQFKQQIYRKIAYNNLYIRDPHTQSYEEVDLPDVDVMAMVHASGKVYLLVT